MAVTFQNYFQNKTKSTLNSGNTCYVLVYNLLSSLLLYKISVHLLKEFGNLLHTFREGQRTGVYENRVAERSFWMQRWPITRGLENRIVGVLLLKLNGWKNSERHVNMIRILTRESKKQILIVISNFRHVLNTLCFLLGSSPTSELYMPTFRNTLFVPSSQAGGMKCDSSHTSLPRRLNYICRRFGTLYLFHIHRQVV